MIKWDLLLYFKLCNIIPFFISIYENNLQSFITRKKCREILIDVEVALDKIKFDKIQNEQEIKGNF